MAKPLLLKPDLKGMEVSFLSIFSPSNIEDLLYIATTTLNSLVLLSNFKNFRIHLAFIIKFE